MNHLENFITSVKEWVSKLESIIFRRENNLNEDQLQNLYRKVEKLKSLLVNKPAVITSDYINSLNNGVKSVKSYLNQLNEGIQPKPNSSTLNNEIEGVVEVVPIGKHILPPLPYEYSALEPYISTEIMKLHHQVHHQSYVDGLNKAEIELEKARNNNDYSLVKHWERELAFHGSGHYLHAMFWDNMKKNGGGTPSGDLLSEITRSFGSFEKFKKHFTEAALKVEGVGWAILVWSPRARRLEILQTEKQQLFTQWDTIPLLGLDVWEHAYYLQYKANRNEYVNNWWKLVNWDNVSMRLNTAKNVRWNAL
ncbi:MAG: superoxide dismutase [Bacillales bacterium]|jgi:Fe-Mn family superoxide dismutase|nr:superoxide dismutase [Bacillales bacterium]